MRDNIIGILNQIKLSLDDYEACASAEKLPPHERMMTILERDYTRLCNREEWIAAFREMFTDDEAAAWCLFPEYTRTEIGMTVSEAAAEAETGIAEQLPSLVKSLVDKGFLYPYPENRYCQTYLLDLLADGIINHNGSALHKACLNWWMELKNNPAESSKLTLDIPAHRVVTHEAAITGETRHGRVPMNIDIPDTRKILETDKMSAMLARCRRYAVMECICRKATEEAGTRECDSLMEVCLLLDESADGAVEMGAAREITMEEALDILKACRDQGLVQVTSNAEHPLTICNCCECCCVCLISMSRNEKAIAEGSRFVIDVARSTDCIKCGVCMNTCPAQAIEVHENYVQTWASKCIGCGICASKCPKGVLRMIEKPGAPKDLPQQYIKRPYI